MKAEAVLSLYFGISKLLAKVQQEIKNAAQVCIDKSAAKIDKIHSKMEKDTAKYDEAMNKLSNKYIGKGIVNTEKLVSIDKRNEELKKLLS